MSASSRGPIVVLGDIMLDTFEEGVVERLSPEAPVPVLSSTSARHVLGGAANTAVNVRALGEDVLLVGIVGRDAAGDRCRELLGPTGVGDHVVVSADAVTTVKMRFIAGGHQILRWDTEEPVPGADVDELVRGLGPLVAGASAVVISDYHKGVITDECARVAVRLAREHRVPCIVDSKRVDPGVFAGCTVIAPNALEASRMTGTTVPEVAAESISRVTGSAVLVTLGADGMLLWADGRSDHIESTARAVADVTGAGDSVTAGLAVSLVRGLSLHDSASFANSAAAVAVGHSGTHAVTADEVADYLRHAEIG